MKVEIAKCPYCDGDLWQTGIDPRTAECKRCGKGCFLHKRWITGE